MTRFSLLLPVPAALGLLLLAGCGPVEEGIAYSDVVGSNDEAPAAVAETGDAPDEALAGIPGDASPVGDGEAGEVEEPAANVAEVVLASAEGADAADTAGEPAEMAEEEEDDGFTGGFSGGFTGGFTAAASNDEPVAMPAPTAAEILNEEPAEPRDLKLLVPTNSFSPAGNGTVRVSFDDLDLLKVLNAEPVPADVVDHFPDWLRNLDGEKVTLRGFMYPTYADPVRAFILARDNQICCFGRNPKPYDLVTVKLAEGQESRYIQNRPFDVVGTFHLDPRRDGDDWLRLYRIDGAQVVE